MKKIDGTLIFNLVKICLFLFGLIWLFVIHSPIESASIIIGFNSSLQWSKNWIGLYAIYFIEFFIVTVLWSLVLSSIYNVVNSIYTKLTVMFIRKKRILIKLIRFYYGFKKVYLHLRKGTFGTSIGNDHNLFQDLTAPTLTEWIKFFFLFFISIGSRLAAVLTIITLYYSYILVCIESFKHQWYNLFFSLWNNVFSKLSSVVVFILIIFLCYFVSGYGVRRRAIAQANKKKLEDVIELFRKLEKPVHDIVVEGSKNLEYALNCYNSIYEFWTLKEFNTLPKEYRKLVTRRINFHEEYFLFNDITALNDLIKILEEMNKSENKKFVFWFANYRYELRKFRYITTCRPVKKLEDYERLLFTKKGFDKMSNANQYQQKMKIDEEMIREELAFNREKLNRNIIDGLELIYAFHRYIEVIHKILHIDSDKIGRGIRQFTGKE